MIAVYFCYGIRENEGKEGLYVIPVEDDDYEVFLELVGKGKEYPFPDSEVVFLEGDKEINRFDYA